MVTRRAEKVDYIFSTSLSRVRVPCELGGPT
uniref:Uncharacterized protein n=1 Tax=Rhizophora mucronata TaxID=61149 RepID=A0A2P2L783_RHIMU